MKELESRPLSITLVIGEKSMNDNDCRGNRDQFSLQQEHPRRSFASIFKGMVFYLENSDLYTCASLATFSLQRRMIATEHLPHLRALLEDSAAQNGFHRVNDGQTWQNPPQEWFGLRWKVALWKTVMQDAMAPTIGRIDLLVLLREEA